MKVAIFCTEDAKGGAARACQRLTYGLVKNDKVNINYFVKHKTEDTNYTLTLESDDNDFIETSIEKFCIKEKRTTVTNTLFSLSYNDSKLPDLSHFDIVNLHWIEHFISLNNLYELTHLNKPIVWTLHDMKPFTGGCHYSATCEDYKGDCGHCQQLSSDIKKLPRNVLDLKKEILNDANITIVAPSVWLADEAKKSSLFKTKRIEVIPYGIDSSIFKPTDKNIAKKVLGVDENSVVLAFGVMSHAERRKGFEELVQAMNLLKERLNNKKVVALFFGAYSDCHFPIPVINAGYIDNDEKLSLIYSATDIFILPSLEDNLPNTILESLSCATPIIAFDTGGARDIINDSNGTIVPKGDIMALSDAVYKLIENEALRVQKGKNGRQLMLHSYQLHHQASAYLKLFEELKNKCFKYKFSTIDVNSYFDSIFGYVYRYNKTIKELQFSRNFNNFFEQVKKLDQDCVVYGNGTIGKTIQTLIPERVVGWVDIKDEKHHPRSLSDMQYDKIIISVLGRENEIATYLINELNVPKEKIVIFSL
jgi:glycosyltransferase involved in cell wall biosynthesis